MPERVEPTKELLDALIRTASQSLPRWWTGQQWVDAIWSMNRLRDAILASQPERVECKYCNPQPQSNEFQGTRARWSSLSYKICPYCGQSLKGAGE